MYGVTALYLGIGWDWYNATNATLFAPTDTVGAGVWGTDTVGAGVGQPEVRAKAVLPATRIPSFESTVCAPPLPQPPYSQSAYVCEEMLVNLVSVEGDECPQTRDSAANLHMQKTKELHDMTVASSFVRKGGGPNGGRWVRTMSGFV
eukprot:364851-Chlamydomonas_euryale.AAC.3